MIMINYRWQIFRGFLDIGSTWWLWWYWLQNDDCDDNNDNAGGGHLVGPLVLSWTLASPLAPMSLSLFLSLRWEGNHDDHDNQYDEEEEEGRWILSSQCLCLSLILRQSSSFLSATTSATRYNITSTKYNFSIFICRGRYLLCVFII